jgi:uncharacterized membrane protein
MTEGENKKMDNKLSELFESRKFWAAVIGVVLMIVQSIFPDFPLSAEQITDVVYLLVAFIIGTAIESKPLK